MIDETKAKELVKKYCPETKLQLKNGCDGLYMTETDTILIGRDWNISGLLHEITHAMLYKEDSRVGHDGVFADKLTKLCGEVFEENPKIIEGEVQEDCKILAKKLLEVRPDLEEWVKLHFWEYL